MEWVVERVEPAVVVGVNRGCFRGRSSLIGQFDFEGGRTDVWLAGGLGRIFSGWMFDDVSSQQRR